MVRNRIKLCPQGKNALKDIKTYHLIIEVNLDFIDYLPGEWKCQAKIRAAFTMSHPNIGKELRGHRLQTRKYVASPETRSAPTLLLIL
jgi:hypothetical protein